MKALFVRKRFFLLIFVSLFSIIEGQSCRNFFSYALGSDGNTVGQITLFLPKVLEHNLKVILTVAAQLPSTYVGEISLVKDANEVAKEVNNGGAVQYRVRFPISNPIPKFTEIFHNDVSICKGERATSNDYITTITLRHRLRIPISHQNNAASYDSDSFAPPHEIQATTEAYVPIQYTSSLSFQEYVTQYSPIKRYSPTPNSIPGNPIMQSSYQCGIRESDRVITSLVVNGLRANRNEFPWLVVQYHIRRHFTCGGSLVSNRIVITAAHCIWDKNKPQAYSAYDLTYYMGKYKLADLQEDGYISSDVHSLIVHPKWKPHESTYDSDIAIAVLVKRIHFSATIKPICIWSNGVGHNDIVGRRGIIAGWGLTEQGKISEYPMFLSLPVVDDAVCLRSNPAFVKISAPTNFCVGDQSGSVPCQGDSGGAFVVRYGSQFYLRGIVSAAIVDEGRCSRKDFTLLTDVSHYSEWIKYYIAQYSN